MYQITKLEFWELALAYLQIAWQEALARALMYWRSTKHSSKANNHKKYTKMKQSYLP